MLQVHMHALLLLLAFQLSHSHKKTSHLYFCFHKVFPAYLFFGPHKDLPACLFFHAKAFFCNRQKQRQASFLCTVRSLLLNKKTHRFQIVLPHFPDFSLLCHLHGLIHLHHLSPLCRISHNQ